MRRVLLDANMRQGLRALLAGRDVQTNRQTDWDWLTNGDLLAAEAAGPPAPAASIRTEAKIDAGTSSLDLVRQVLAPLGDADASAKLQFTSAMRPCAQDPNGLAPHFDFSPCGVCQHMHCLSATLPARSPDSDDSTSHVLRRVLIAREVVWTFR